MSQSIRSSADRGRFGLFIIMGASGGGKSSLLRVLTGLVPAASGRILIDGVDFTAATENERAKIMQKCGILYQSGALFSSNNTFLGYTCRLQLQSYASLLLCICGIVSYICRRFAGTLIYMP